MRDRGPEARLHSKYVTGNLKRGCMNRKLCEEEKDMYEIWFARAEGDIYRCRLLKGCLHMEEKISDDELVPAEHAVVISEDPETLKMFKNKGYCCIGYTAGRDAFFEGAECVITDFDHVSEDLIRREYDHHFGIPHVIAETERLRIRESTEEDYPAINEMIRENEGASVSFFSQGDSLSREEYLDYISITYSFFEYGNWSVLEKETGEIAGWCGLNPVREPSGGDMIILHCQDAESDEESSRDEGVELGYVIRRDKRKRGYALEACTAILQYARQELGITKFCVQVSAGNESSLRLARKLGFQ